MNPKFSDACSLAIEIQSLRPMRNSFGRIRSNLFRNKHLLQHAATEGCVGEEGLVCGRFSKNNIVNTTPTTQKIHFGMWLPASSSSGVPDKYVGGPPT